MCHFELSIPEIEMAHQIDFKSYFAAEIAALREMEEGGLLIIGDRYLTIEPRVIAMAFDRYLNSNREQVRYSKVI